MKSIRKFTGRVEFYIGLVFIALCLLIQVRSGQFFTSNNIVDILSALVVPGIFAIGEFMVIVSGGFDVSFPALASLSAFATTKLFLDMNYQGSALVPKERMPWGMVASCLELSVPCMKPLNTEEVPRVTIMAGSSK